MLQSAQSVTDSTGGFKLFPLDCLWGGKRLDFSDVFAASKHAYRHEYRQKSALLILLALFRDFRGMHLSACIVFYHDETSVRRKMIARTFGPEQRLDLPKRASTPRRFVAWARNGLNLLFRAAA